MAKEPLGYSIVLFTFLWEISLHKIWDLAEIPYYFLKAHCISNPEKPFQICYTDISVIVEKS